MIKKQTLIQLFSASTEKSFLFLGRESLFTHDEIARFLKKYQIKLTTSYEENTTVSIESKRLNPVEEDISNLVYDDKIPSFSLDEFEQQLSREIDDDTLLMGVKLSNDQTRIFRLLGNPYISETLFLKLLMLYHWKTEEEDNIEDRDVIMYTLKRYIDIKPNEADLLYSYLTLRRLATEAINPKLLLALLRFQNFSFLVRGKEKVTLHQTVARNRCVDKEVVAQLLSFRDAKVDVALACNENVEASLLQRFLLKEASALDEALASNPKIDETIFEALLHKTDKVLQLLLFSQPINTGRFVLIDALELEDEVFSTLGANVSLDSAVIKALIAKKSEALLVNLAQNHSLQDLELEAIYAKGNKTLFSLLADNPQLPVARLESFYREHDNETMHCALAHNPSTPEEILRALFAKDNFEIQKSLASNASVPLDILDILKIDTRLQNELAENAILVKAYEVVLDYDKKAVQF